MIDTIRELPDVLLLLPTTDELIKSPERSDLAPAYGLNLVAAAFRKAGRMPLVLDEFTVQHAPDYHLLPGWEAILDRALATYPGIRMVGFSMLTNFRKEVVELSRHIRAVRPELFIVWGGPHVTALGAPLQNRFKTVCDVMVSGPLDRPVLDAVVNLLETGHRPDECLLLQGKDSDPFIFTCLPDYSAYHKFFSGRFSKLILRTSSGCPTPGCIFCSALFLEGRYKLGSPVDIQAQVRHSAAFQPQRLEFHDQDLLFDLNHLKSIAPDAVLQEIDTCYCHSGVDSVFASHLEYLKDTPPNWEIFVGLESASPRVYKTVCKKRLGPQSLGHLLDMIRLAGGKKIRFGLFVMVGIPGEQYEDILLTQQFIDRAEDVEVCVNMMKVFPGTVIARQMIRAGSIPADLWLNENGPRVVSAVSGDDYKRAKNNWLMLLDAFPNSKKHNTIDRNLFHL